MKKFINIVNTILIAVVVLLSLTLVFSKPIAGMNFSLYSVNSGSMEPAIKLGSLVLVKSQENYSKNDVITFRDEADPRNTTTHRIVAVVEDKDINKLSFRTKGDANENEDTELIDSRRVVGKVVFSLPYLGYGASFAKTQMGFVLLIVIPATIIIYSELQNIRGELKNKFGKKEKDIDNDTDTDKNKDTLLRRVRLDFEGQDDENTEN